MFQPYLDRGLSVIPIAPNQKYPARYSNGKYIPYTGWDEYSRRLATAIEAEYWAGFPAPGIGLCLGRVSGIIALDLDNPSSLFDLPDTPCKKRGANGFTAFYSYSGEKSQKFRYRGQKILELLSDGNQTVLPPSIHPSGKAYEWIGEPLPCELPALDPEFLAYITDICSSPRQAQKSFISHSTTHEEIRDALKHIDPSSDYDTWLKVGMAIHSFDSGAFELWNAWSALSPKYVESEMEGKWNSFRGGGRTIASLFELAIKAGYRKEYPKIEIEEGGNLKPKSCAPETIANCPGLPGSLAEWIDECSLYRQPELSIAASLAAIGVIKGHRLRTNTNLRSNILCIGVADSGTGKGHALAKLNDFFEALDLSKILSGRPVSDAGLLSSLKKGQGRRLILWDEFGVALGEMTSGRASTHKEAILGLVMELFSAANTNFRGKEYADPTNSRARDDINQPCLCLYGVSTPQRLQDALSSAHGADGFAPRFLIFEGNEQHRQKPIHTDLPQDILEEAIRINALSTDIHKTGNLSGAINPNILPFSDSVASKLDDAIEFFDAKRRAHRGSGPDAFWARAMEHCFKLCLIVEEYDQVSLKTFDWCFNAAKILTERSIRMAGEYADSPYEKCLVRAKKVITEKGPLTLSQFHRAMSKFDRRQRDDVIISLGQMEFAATYQVEGRTKPKTMIGLIKSE